MLRLSVALFVFAASVSVAQAEDSKQVSCQYQADVVAAVQEARLNKVAERDVAKHIVDSDPAWPENYNAAIPLIAPWVYEQKMRTIRNDDLSAAWMELCLQQG